MLNEAYRNRLKKQKEKCLLRNRYIVQNSDEGNNKILMNGKSYIDFSSNDYLGLKNNSEIAKAFSKAAKFYGFGSGASAIVSGYSNEHHETELQFSKWLNVDKAVLFNSGYLANLGILNALANRTSKIFSDKLCHASILDGIQLSRAKHYRYKHCDIEHFSQLSKYRSPDLIVTESVFSMGGNIAPISELIRLSKKYQSALVIDDAHGIGVLGQQGSGICKYYGISQEQYTCLILPLGKAFNGLGAIVAGRREIIDLIIQFSRTYHYTTALPPAICVGLRASLDVVKNETWRREKLKNNINLFISSAANSELELVSKAETPIKSILVYDNERVMAIQELLLSKGLFVSAIRPPSVPHNMSRLRISLNCLHTEEEILYLIKCLSRALKKC